MQPASPVAARLRGFASAPLVRSVVWWVAAGLVAFAAAGFLIVPPLAKRTLEQQLSQLLHRPVTVEAVRVNPFVPSITVRGFAVREPQGDLPWAGFEELYVNASWASLFRLAPVVDEITLSRPRLRLVRNADGRYNVQDLVEAYLARPKSDTPRFAMFNARLLEGRIEFEDRLKGERHVVDGLRIGVPFVSTLPSHAATRVQAEFAASVNGAPFELKGESLPFVAPRATGLQIRLDGFNLVRLLDYLPVQPRAKLHSALLDANLELSFEQPAGAAPRIKLAGTTAMRQLDVRDAQDRPVLAFNRLGVEINVIDPLAPSIDLKSVELEQPALQVVRDQSGLINLTQLGPVAGKPAAATPASRERSAIPVKIDRLAIRSGKIGFTDQIAPFQTRFEDLQLQATGIDLQQARASDWKLSARSDAGETLSASAKASAEPLAAEGRLDLRAVVLKRYQPYLSPITNLALEDGRLDGGFAFKWARAQQQLEFTDVGLELKALRTRLPGEAQPVLRVGSLQVKGASVDAVARTLNLGEIGLRDAAVFLRREKQGSFNVARVAKPQAGTQAARSDRPWRIELARASLERGSVTLQDLSLGEPETMSIAPLQLRAERLSTASGRRGNISLNATVNRTGTVSASGPLTLQPFATRLGVEVRHVDLAPVQRYVAERINFAITSGSVSAKGNTVVESAEGKTKATYQGDLALEDFASIDKRSSLDWLKWKSLSFGGSEIATDPLRVSIDQIALSDFYARIMVSPEGRLNLQDLVKSGEAPPAPAPEASGPQASPKQPGLPPNVRIGKVALQDGRVNFTDSYIKPNYSADLSSIAGSVTEMTPEKAGQVELRAKLEGSAPVEILGQLNPLAPNLFLDLNANARDIELPPMSPYAAKYAGYGIERGKLSMKVTYHLENRKLEAQNNVYLDQLTFGAPVESPSATKLPVRLAVALLKDRDGVIDINLPISGSLDDPQFSVGGIIIRVLVNLITKAVTAPFALIGSLFGGGEELAYYEFAPGSASIAGGEEGKLKNLAKALGERPGLKLEITGRVEPDADREGLKRALVDHKVRAQKFNDMRRAGSAPASVDGVKVQPEEYEKYLRLAYGAESFKKPRNLIGLAKTLPVPEVEQLMLQNTSVAEDDLRRLANERAQAAKDWLVSEGKVPAERVFIIAPKLTMQDLKDKGKPTRADFALK